MLYLQSLEKMADIFSEERNEEIVIGFRGSYLETLKRAICVLVQDTLTPYSTGLTQEALTSS